MINMLDMPMGKKKKPKKKKSYRRTRADAGWTWGKYSKERGPNGRGLCRLCKKEVPPGRRTFCSPECVHNWKITSDPGYVRIKLWERDKGVCAICGLDTVKLVAQLEKEFEMEKRWGYRYYNRGGEYLYGEKRKIVEDRLAEFGITTSRWYSRRSNRGIWDADHATPVIEGGGECGLDGFRTLCCKCHKEETNKLRQRLREKRMQEQLKPVSYKLFGGDDDGRDS